MSNDLPLYLKVYHEIKSRIVNGTYPVGNHIPSENEMCFMFKVTRPTVRQAMAKLVHEGFIKKQRGKLAIVTLPKQALGILSVQSTSNAFKTSDLITHLCHRPQLLPFPKNFIFDTHDIPQAIYFERLRVQNQAPVLLEKTYLAHTLPVDVNFWYENLHKNASLFQLLADHFQIQITGGAQNIYATLPEQNICKLLKINNNIPVLYVERKINTSNPLFHIYSFLYCNTETCYLSAEF